MATLARTAPADLVDLDLLRSEAVADWLDPVEIRRVRVICSGRSTVSGRAELRELGVGATFYGVYEPGDDLWPGPDRVAQHALKSIAQARRRAAVVAWAKVCGFSRAEAAARLGLRWC